MKTEKVIGYWTWQSVLGHDIKSTDPKTQRDKCNAITLKSFFASKEVISKTKRQAIDGETIFQNIYDK